MITERFHVPEVSCQHCVHSVTQEITTLAGVHNVTVDLSAKSVVVEHTGTVNTDAIIAAINEAGFDDVTKLA